MHETIVGLMTHYGYGILFALVALESLGVPLPGETALITAAALAGQGRLSLAGVIITAAGAAIVGDSAGYWIGRTAGIALLRRHGRLVRIDEQTIARVQAFFARHGAKTVFIGRFVAVLRSWAAFFAGAGGMRYGEFMAFNAIGGVVWAGLFGALGFAFGVNLPRLEHDIGRVSVLLALSVAVVIGVTLLLRRRVALGVAIGAAIQRARVSAARHLGATLIVGLVVSLLALGVFAAITEDVVNHDPITAFDVAVAHAFRAHATPSGDLIAAALSTAGSPIALSTIGLIVAGLLVWHRRWFPLCGWLAAFAGGGLLTVVLKQLMRRPRPLGSEAYLLETSWSFPSGHAMMSLVVYGMLTYLGLAFTAVPRRARGLMVGVAVVLIGGIGFSRLYLGVHYVSDVAGGLAAGLCWLAVCISGVESVRYPDGSA